MYVFHYVDAARRFFQSKCEEALKDKGKYERKVTLQRCRNRLLRDMPVFLCLNVSAMYIACCHASIIIQCLVTLTKVGVKKGCITQNILVEGRTTGSVEESGG